MIWFSTILFLLNGYFWMNESLPSCRDLEECINDCIDGTGESVSCNGEFSCYHAPITVSDISASSDNLYFFGDSSGMKGMTQINDLNPQNPIYTYAYGAFSMAETSIRIGGNVEFIAYFYGYYSGYNSVIICEDDAECTINCAAFGCIGLKLYCDTTSSICVKNENNQFAEFGFLSDSGYYRGLLVYRKIPMMKALLNSNPSYTVSESHGSVWNCQSWLECSNSNNIFVGYSYTNVYCSGSYSCQESSVNLNFMYSGIYCTGAASCLSSVITAYSGIKNLTVYCGGYWSCKDTKIISAQKIYMLGAYSGVGSSIISYNYYGNNKINVYFAGYKSGDFSSINCHDGDTCNIFCEDEYSCDNTTTSINCWDSNNGCNNVNVYCFSSGINTCTTMYDLSSCNQINYDSTYNIYGIKCDNNVLWQGAQNYCKYIYNTDLVSINNNNKNNAVSNSVNNKNAWIGLSDIDNEGTFVWSDDTPLTYSNWYGNNPNNYNNEDCVVIKTNKEWNDGNCQNGKEYFACNSQ